MSDKETNFEGTAVILKWIYKSPEVVNYLSNRLVEWRFIPKRAPHYGGFAERIIGLLKTTLREMFEERFFLRSLPYFMFLNV